MRANLHSGSTKPVLCAVGVLTAGGAERSSRAMHGAGDEQSRNAVLVVGEFESPMVHQVRVGPLAGSAPRGSAGTSTRRSSVRQSTAHPSSRHGGSGRVAGSMPAAGTRSDWAPVTDPKWNVVSVSEGRASVIAGPNFFRAMGSPGGLRVGPSNPGLSAADRSAAPGSLARGGCTSEIEKAGSIPASRTSSHPDAAAPATVHGPRRWLDEGLPLRPTSLHTRALRRSPSSPFPVVAIDGGRCELGRAHLPLRRSA